MDPNWRVLLTAASQDRDQVEAEVWYGDEQWAVLSDEDNTIRFFHRQAEEARAFLLEDVLAILNAVAKKGANGAKSAQGR